MKPNSFRLNNDDSNCVSAAGAGTCRQGEVLLFLLAAVPWSVNAFICVVLFSTVLRLHLQSTFTASEELPGLAVMGAACSFWLLQRQNMSTRWLLTKSSESET